MIHLYRESSFFLAVFWSFQLDASHAGLSGAEFSLPPQQALQSASLFPKQSLHLVLPHPCSLCLPTLSPLMSTSCTKLGLCPQINSGHQTIFLGQKQPWPPGHSYSEHSHEFPRACLTPGLGGSSEAWWGGMWSGCGERSCPSLPAH